MNYSILLLDGVPAWLFPIIIVVFFGLIAGGVFLVRKYAKPFKNDEKPKTDKEIAEEEVSRLTQELNEQEYEEAKERKAKKEGKPTEEEALQEELSRMIKPVEDEKTIKEMEDFTKNSGNEK